MAAPTRWVLTVSEGARPRRIDDPLNAATDPAGGFRHREPDWLQDGEHVLGSDMVNRQLTKGLAIHSQGHLPLGPVLWVLPARLHRLDQRIGNSAE